MPKLGEPDDRYEREAEQVADRFARSGSQSSTGEAREEVPSGRPARRGAPGRGESAAGLDASVPHPGHGKPLTSTERRLYEPFFAVDLSAVRLHTGERARRSADALDAEAYATGHRVVFGDDRYGSSEESRRLLAHELAHVVLHTTPGTIRRSPNGEETSAEYDPCLVEVGTLSNDGLLREWWRARGYLDERERGEGDYYDYANLMRRLVAERRERVRQGHVWLAVEDLHSVPSELYEMRSAGGRAVRVAIVEGSQARGEPERRTGSSVLTPGQFEDYLERQDIPEIDVREFYARQAELPEAHREQLEFLLPPPEMPARTPVGPLDFGWNRQPTGGFGSPLLNRMFAPEQFGSAAGGSGFGGGRQLPAGFDGPFTAPGAPAGPLFGGPPARRGEYDPDTPLAGMAGTSASGLGASSFDLAARSAVSRPVYTSGTDMSNPNSVRGAERHWRGVLPEIAMTSGDYRSMLRHVDLNQVQKNFPGLDVGPRRGTGAFYQVTHTEGGVNEGRMREKFRITIGNTEPGKLDDAIEILNDEQGRSLTVEDINRRNYLAVPDDQVAGTRQVLRDAIAGRYAQPGSYSNVLDAMLKEQPVEVDGRTYSSWNEVQAARSDGLGTDGYRRLREVLGERVRSRVVGVGMTMPEIQAMQQHRAAAQHLGPRAYRAVASPELLETVRYRAQGMDEGPARSRVARGGAMRGGAVGGVGSLATGTARIIMDDSGNPQIVRTIGVDVPLGVAGGASEAYVEARLGARLSERAFQRATTEGVSATAARGWAGLGFAGRGLGATVAGGAAAPAVTLAGMGIDDLFFGGEQGGIDYAAKGGRAAVSGSIAAGSGFLVSAGIGAAAGSWAPGVGTAVGFLVGAGVYFAADATVGETVEGEIRERMGEEGCVDG